MTIRRATDERQAMFDKFTPLYDTFEPWVIDALVCIMLYPQHDRGPDCAWERLFEQAPLDHYVNYSGTPFHTRFGPVFYRGRLDGSARVLVVGQDPAVDELLARRAFVGTAGRIAQSFLTKLGLTRSYLMFNTYLFGIQSSSLDDKIVVPTDPTITAYRNQLFDRAKASNKLEAVIAFGGQARDAVKAWPGRGALPLIELYHPTAKTGVAASWNAKLSGAQKAIKRDNDGAVDTTPFDTQVAVLPGVDIPRRDLPFGLPTWHGTAAAPINKRGAGTAFETQLIWNAP